MLNSIPRALRSGERHVMMQAQVDVILAFESCLHAGILHHQPKIIALLFRDKNLSHVVQSSELAETLEEVLFVAAMHVADEEMVNVLLEHNLGHVVTEWRLSESERELRWLKEALASPGTLDADEHRLRLIARIRWDAGGL